MSRGTKGLTKFWDTRVYEYFDSKSENRSDFNSDFSVEKFSLNSIGKKRKFLQVKLSNLEKRNKKRLVTFLKVGKTFLF